MRICTSFVSLTLTLLICGCQTVYYDTMERMGIHKRDILVERVEEAQESQEEAKDQFGFLMNAFEYGAPPHGGLAFGLDRLVAILGGQETIRDFIAFPKNNSGRDVMIDAPSKIDESQLKELRLKLDL